jgi:hypothetical protein
MVFEVVLRMELKFEKRLQQQEGDLEATTRKIALRRTRLKPLRCPTRWMTGGWRLWDIGSKFGRFHTLKKAISYGEMENKVKKGGDIQESQGCVT